MLSPPSCCFPNPQLLTLNSTVLIGFWAMWQAWGMFRYVRNAMARKTELKPQRAAAVDHMLTRSSRQVCYCGMETRNRGHLNVRDLPRS